MAEGFFNHLAAQRGSPLRAASAGTLGGGVLNPTVVSAMAEVGVPIDAHVPKQLTRTMVDGASLVVSMGCGVDAEACPARFLVAEDWGLDDPKGQPLQVVREIRDVIRARCETLLDRL